MPCKHPNIANSKTSPPVKLTLPVIVVDPTDFKCEMKMGLVLVMRVESLHLDLPVQLPVHAGHLIGCGKNGKLCGNFRQYYAEESDDDAEKTPDYAEFSKINKVVPLAFSNL